MSRFHWQGCGPERSELFGMPGARGFSLGPGGFHFDFGDGPGRGGRGDGRRGGRRMFGSGELRLVLLKLIADQPRHGYELRKAMEEMTNGGYAPSPGALYPTLIALADEGLLIEQEIDTSVRKLYAVTEQGKQELADKAGEVEALFERLQEAFPKRGDGHPPIGRAIGNLMTALRQRVAHDGLDERLVHEITDILDEAAKRIERLG